MIHKREERNPTDLFLRKGESFLSRGLEQLARYTPIVSICTSNLSILYARFTGYGLSKRNFLTNRWSHDDLATMIQRNGLKKKKKKKKGGVKIVEEKKIGSTIPERGELILGLRQTSRNRIAHAFNFTRERNIYIRE